jgi:predicted nucleic acid-binding protein
MNYTLDAGALIAIERRKQRAVHLLVTGRVMVPAPCFAEWWRGRTDRREDIRRAIQIDWLTEATLRMAGEALAAVPAGRRGRPTTIDAIAMASAASRKDDVLATSDPEDMFRLQAFFPSVRILVV